MTIFRIFCIGLLSLLPLSAYAAEKTDAIPAKEIGAVAATPAKLSDDDLADIKKAEEYLNGTFYLQRPGKLRFQYDPPVQDFVVADGTFIYFYDAELNEQSNAPIGQTLADFILRDHLKLNGDLTVLSVKHGGGLLQIKVAQASDPNAGTLTLGFTEEPFALKKWRIVDAQNLITEVELFYLKTGITHPDGLFVYKDPNKAPRHAND